MRMSDAAVILLAMFVAGTAHGAGFRTKDPLKAFVNGEYELGSDYFIHGNGDTQIFRCLTTKKSDGYDGVALSEISIWGNHGGPWEIFKKSKSGDYAFAGTRELPNTSCLEWCGSKEYLSSGRCTWRRGFPK
jgi:hypothetical protein